MNSDMMLRWYQGGRKVSSPTSQRGGKITKSTLARPGDSLGEVSTVKMDGSGWSKLIVPIVMNLAVSYLYGRVVPVPADHVQRRMVVVGGPQVPAELLHHLDGRRPVLVGGRRG